MSGVRRSLVVTRKSDNAQVRVLREFPGAVLKRQAGTHRRAAAVSRCVGGGMTETLQQVIAERDALQAEVAKLRAWMPKWKRGSYGRSLWSIPVPGKKLQVWRYDSRWFWAFSDGWEQPSTDRDAAMRAAEAADGLPQCEVVE